MWTSIEVCQKAAHARFRITNTSLEDQLVEYSPAIIVLLPLYLLRSVSDFSLFLFYQRIQALRPLSQILPLFPETSPPSVLFVLSILPQSVAGRRSAAMIAFLAQD